MVRLTRIYTRGGDAGDTSLGDGARVKKDDLRVEAFGTVDEANAAIGLARLSAVGDIDGMLARIQNDLFDLGADLCTPEDGRRAAGALRIQASQVARLEQEIDALNAALKRPPLCSQPARQRQGRRRRPVDAGRPPMRTGRGLTAGAKRRGGVQGSVNLLISLVDKRNVMKLLPSRCACAQFRCAEQVVAGAQALWKAR